MNAHATEHSATRTTSLDDLRAAAWVQYLLDHLDNACDAALDSGDRHLSALAAATSTAIDARRRRGQPLDSTLLAPWRSALLRGDDCPAREQLDRLPCAGELTAFERYFAGSRQVHASAYGVAEVWGTDDTRIGVAALFAAARGADAFGTLATLPIAAPQTQIERETTRIAIDDTIGRIWQPDEAQRSLDEMAALAHCAACLAMRHGAPLALYGGEHNRIACAIRRDRPDLASPDGLLVALALCRLDELIGGDSFWVYYLLAGIAIAAPQIVEDIGRRFYGDAWQTWFDALLRRPSSQMRTAGDTAGFARLRDAMHFMAPRNPVGIGRRRRTMS
ncbi:hypothetical protein [Burkholderia pseudomultivorans]|uniref:hypothetical protein n=1 Tax=Burkholderia pseudomultivorans TaxID=1207504 RepID=UPI00188DDA42|nr:hypothetical protein [Burkholderia pseudomultivorans]MBF5008253.1 hypothetical protein [Burkholderia pseudomultivorans]